MPSETKKTILIIEDEPVMMGLLSKKLEQEGFAVKGAGNGASGLELIRAGRPDLVLLDMMLPKLSGFGVLEKLDEEKILPGLAMIIISNSGQPVEIDRALKFGVRDYLIKVNFDLGELVDKIKVVLGKNGYVESRGETSKHSVMIVEDDPFLIDLLEKKFIKSRIRVFRAMDPETARLVLQREHPDAILLDIMLPGTDGINLLKEWKAAERLKDIPVVITSNLGQIEEIERGMKAGAIDYLVKSNSTPGEIVSKVLEIINK